MKGYRNRTSEHAHPAPNTGPAKKSSFRSTAVQLAYLLVFVLFISVSIYVDRDAKDSLVRGIPAGNGWTIESDDTQTDVDHFPPGSLSIFKEVKGSYTAGQALCLKSIDTDFDVYADGRLIYTYRPTIPKRLGRSNGMYVHTVAIPDQTSVLTLKLDPVFPEISAGLKASGSMIRNSTWLRCSGKTS